MAVKQLTGSMQASTVLAGERNPRRARLRGRTSAPRRPPACRQCLALVAEPALAVSFVDLRPLVVLAPGRVIDPLPRARDVALERAPQQAAIRLLQEYGLAERAAEFVYGRLRDHPEGDSRHEHWREVMGDCPEHPAAQDGAPPSLALGAWRRALRETPGVPLLPPANRPFPSISASLSPFGCRPSRIASTMSGARQVSGRSRHTKGSVTPCCSARSVID